MFVSRINISTIYTQYTHVKCYRPITKFELMCVVDYLKKKTFHMACVGITFCQWKTLKFNVFQNGKFILPKSWQYFEIKLLYKVV